MTNSACCSQVIRHAIEYLCASMQSRFLDYFLHDNETIFASLKCLNLRYLLYSVLTTAATRQQSLQCIHTCVLVRC